MDLYERIAKVRKWYHRIALPNGFVTPGMSPVWPEAYRLPVRMDGLRVLDVGAWDGYWTFEALKRGAREVVAIDDFSDSTGYFGARSGWDGFDLCREALGYGEDRCKRVTMSVYDAAQLGPFDAVLFFGVLYHLRHPLLGLDVLASICRGRIYVESAICDDFSAHRGGFGFGYQGEMIAEFTPWEEYGDNPSNWWLPSLRTLEAMVRAAGFDPVMSWKLTNNPKVLGHCRGFAVGERKTHGHLEALPEAGG